ncbi:helix-turn-helix transcriptional regulator [Sphaerisporangium sp. TRM90804]|uniref:helix-turn-helix transcriptional regulator n=1 Tax=Sphaerisporangium sp. TRM90804 TaxID=3031113 RepID=UPI00244A5C1A|nr:helix-turn-helix transcriptional regulator [Sphaerisporangium sp. TRM90804]MDH2424612.1 helix-turn-helix transcriptional regulator [Sphaerisporangium sp. TRM90804]
MYRVMLANPSWGVTRIAAHLEVDERLVRESLDELAELALLQPSWDEPGVLRPVSPQVGLSSLLARAEADVAERQRQVEQTRAAILAIAAEHDSSRERDGVIYLQGLDQVRGRLEELAESVAVEVCSFTPTAAQRPDTHEAGKSANQRALERGVVIRGLYQDSFRNDPDTLAYVRWLTELGGQTRSVPTLPMMMIIVDREIALLPVDPSDSGQGAVELRAKGVVLAVYALFEQIWASATPFGEFTPVNEHGLTPLEMQLIEILAEGATDEAAGRKLGLSLRTVRRMMAQIMERLEAQSRFQAGVSAAQRHWVRPSR